MRAENQLNSANMHAWFESVFYNRIPERLRETARAKMFAWMHYAPAGKRRGGRLTAVVCFDDKCFMSWHRTVTRKELLLMADSGFSGWDIVEHLAKSVPDKVFITVLLRLNAATVT